MAARPARKGQFPVSVWDEDSQRYVGWDEMQQTAYRTKNQMGLFRNLRHPFFWTLKASELHEAATVLWTSFESPSMKSSSSGTKGATDVVFMLGGMSIENLLKARRICSQAWPVDDKTYGTLASGGHWLDKQAVAFGFRTNINDRLLLRTLSHYVRWNGRYFLPRTIEEFQGQPSQSGASYAALWNGYVALRQKVYRQLMVAMRRWSA